jgi:hypothetical protein
MERLHGDAIQSAVMEEEIAPLSIDEPEPFV